MNIQEKSAYQTNNYPLIPYQLQKKTHVLMWIKKIHSWSAIISMLFLFFYIFTGWYLQHRAQLKIPLLGYRQEQHFDYPITWNQNITLEQLKKDKILENFILQKLQVFQLKNPPIQKVSIKKNDTIQTLKIAMDNTDYQLESIYVQGNKTVSIDISRPNSWRFMARLHMGNGHSIAAILLVDVFCFAAAMMCLTGLLLWNRKNHGTTIKLALLLTVIPCAIIVILINQNVMF